MAVSAIDISLPSPFVGYSTTSSPLLRPSSIALDEFLSGEYGKAFSKIIKKP